MSVINSTPLGVVDVKIQKLLEKQRNKRIIFQNKIKPR